MPFRKGFVLRGAAVSVVLLLLLLLGNRPRLAFEGYLMAPLLADTVATLRGDCAAVAPLPAPDAAPVR